MDIMKENVKRYRPSLTAYRALENELAKTKESLRLQLLEGKHFADIVDSLKKDIAKERSSCYTQLEGTSALVKDCDAWREKYRQLHAMYEEQLEGISNLVKDCDSWREKYRCLARKYENSDTDTSSDSQALRDEHQLRLEYQDKCASLEHTNRLIEKELDNKRTQCAVLDYKVSYYRNRVMALTSRGFFARLFNRC